MKFLFVLVITILSVGICYAQCPENNKTTVDIKGDAGVDNEVIVKFDKEYESIEKLQVVKFGSGVVEGALIRKKSKKEYVIRNLDSGEYMILVVGVNCSTYVGTDDNYQGFVIN